ncbi:MAG: hypothetical protein ACYCYE_01805 [Clostridia bacterium]
MKKKTLVLLLICLSAVSIGLIGCRSNKPASSAAVDTIKVGWMGSLTGDQSVWGQCELNAVDKGL